MERATRWIKAHYKDGWRLRAYILNHFVSRVPLAAPRMWLYDRLGVHLEDHRDAVILLGTRLWFPKQVSIGRGAVVGRECRIEAGGGVRIGRHVNVSHGVRIQTGKHDIADPEFPASYAPIEIGDHAWLCEACIVLGGATVGEGAVVMAGAVVTKDVEPYAIVGGVPARRIGTRPEVRPEMHWRPNFN